MVWNTPRNAKNRLWSRCSPPATPFSRELPEVTGRDRGEFCDWLFLTWCCAFTNVTWRPIYRSEGKRCDSGLEFRDLIIFRPHVRCFYHSRVTLLPERVRREADRSGIPRLIFSYVTYVFSAYTWRWVHVPEGFRIDVIRPGISRLSINVPRYFVHGVEFTHRKVCAETWILPGIPWLSIRDAVLTVSPNRQ